APAASAVPIAMPNFLARASISFIRLSAVRAALSMPCSNPKVLAMRSMVKLPSEREAISVLLLSCCGDARKEPGYVIDVCHFFFLNRPWHEIFHLPLLPL